VTSRLHLDERQAEQLDRQCHKVAQNRISRRGSEVHVAAGDVVALEDPVITLESDKAAMNIPAPAAGTVGEVVIQVGDRVSKGDLVTRARGRASRGGW
jgi:biotin carboxyl carrier protein